MGIDPFAYAAEERDRDRGGNQYRNSARGREREGDMFDRGLTGFSTLLTYGVEGDDVGGGVEGGEQDSNYVGMTDRLTPATGAGVRIVCSVL